MRLPTRIAEFWRRGSLARGRVRGQYAGHLEVTIRSSTAPPHSLLSHRFSPAADHRVTFPLWSPLAIVAPSGANATLCTSTISRGCAF